MNFSEMQQEVATLTKRPDKVSEIKIAINDAIRNYSLAASFPHDLVEGTVNIDGTIFAQNIVISTNFPRFRKLLYLKRPGATKPLSPVDPLKIITPSGCEQLDKWYRSGDRIYFKLSVLSSTLEYGYYTYPATPTLGTDTHWMLDIIPHVIRSFAMAKIWNSVGEKEEANACEKEANAAFIIAKTDLETGGTY